MGTFLLLNEYEVCFTNATLKSLCGSIEHVYNRRRTPVGYFMMLQEQASEMRPAFWNVLIFFRMGLRYDDTTKTTDIVLDSLTPKWQGWHPDLPKAVGELLLRETKCGQPMQVSCNRYQERGGCQFGHTWCDDDDDE